MRLWHYLPFSLLAPEVASNTEVAVPLSTGAAACSRLVGASCKMRTSMDAAGVWKAYPTVVTLTGRVDAECDTHPWLACTEASTCCGGTAGFACRRQRPDEYGNNDRICQPAAGSHVTNTGPADDPQVREAWQAKGVRFN